jgi:imidazolonepropionase-like amidohydrolase
MTNREPKDIGQIFREGTLIDEAMNLAVRDAVQLHKEKGLPMVVWRDGKIVWITPEEAERSLAPIPQKPPAS